MTSPLQLTATAGIMQNQGIAANVTMLTNISNYENLNLIKPLLQTFVNANSKASLNSTSYTRLKTMGASVCPALSDAVPSSLTSITATNIPAGLTGLIKTGASTVIPSDLTKFIQGFGAALGYTSTINQIINTNKNSSTFLGPTFVNMNGLTTGDLSLVSTNLSKFGQDLTALGSTINLSQLDYLGSPALLLRQMYAAGGVTPDVIVALQTLGLTDNDIALVSDNTVEISDSINAAIYQALKTVTGDALQQVKKVLDVTTVGLTTAADLLNPVKIFPNSFTSLQTTLGGQSVTIYTNSLGTINSTLLQKLPSYFIKVASPGLPYERLKAIIPEDQALANKALTASLQQIKNISNLNITALAATTSTIETNAGLSLVNALTEPVPAATRNYIANTVAGGTGANGTYLLGDILGCGSGYRITQQVGNTVTIIASINTTSLQAVYSTMANTANLQYGNTPCVIPGGQPGAGTYANVDVAFVTLCNLANANISTIASTNAAKVSTLNSDWLAAGTTVQNQTLNLPKVPISYANLTANLTTVVPSFVDSLHDYGTQVQTGGPNEYLLAVATTTNLTGQAIVGSLREGRNLAALADAGVGTNNNIPTT